MTTTPMTIPRTGTLLWLTLSRLDGIASNVFGFVQFAGVVTATQETLVVAGMTRAQAGDC